MTRGCGNIKYDTCSEIERESLFEYENEYYDNVWWIVKWTLVIIVLVFAVRGCLCEC